jgi:EpsD family peptidyl-prolyl cis-trans isomerase
MKTKLALVAAALMASACGGGEGEEEQSLAKGQTVATVNGKDITIHELNAELGGVPTGSGEQRKQIEQAALRSLVGRTILADIARERGIDKSPSYLMQRRRANEALLVQMLQNNVASKIAPPTREEAGAFMQQNPSLFSARKIYTLDQIEFQAPADQAKLREFEPLNSMEQVEQKLIQDRMEHRRAPARLDTVSLNPNFIRQIESLPAGEIFIVPGRGTFLANRITGSEVVPFTGAAALQHAMRLIQQRKVGEALDKELKAQIQKAEAGVKYQTGFGPPPEAGKGGEAPKAVGGAS